ncbi:malectin domain-containing carbohydrate-binding protein [Adhaeribacter radiodurans]|uniref:T9SS type A sorting domain-containing protein n=1 Tax=Adhaeribacter radiodurans TaxID=2745197 RepID=A0A7L7L6A1_9BACT|nr:malectin domain-containing carbohydrate-binding protein [Adhaeribacter radiodurans]QMU28361.1 T9SS type A sorting domain-containing protein [Adhaeribacter radiodurans]
MLKIYSYLSVVANAGYLKWLVVSAICLFLNLPVRADELVYRINAGGSSTSSSVGTFAADKYYSPSPGYITSTTKAIANTNDDVMYRTQRGSNTNNGTFNYNLPVSNGQYRVKLFLAEIYWTKVGQRVFDVTAEKTKVLDNYDAVRRVGAFTATNETFTINVSDGTLNLYFSALASDGGVNRPQISGLEIVKVTTTSTDFTRITWGTAASQPYGTHEVHGETVNGKLYIFGGYDVTKSTFTPTKRAFCYDPKTNTWKAIADLPHTPKGTNFGGITHVGTATDGTNIFFAGGYPSNSTGTGQVFGTRQVWRYNVANNNYTALPNLPAELAAGQLKYLNGRLHYLGGANKSRADVSVHYTLDLNNLSAGWKTLASLPNATNHGGSVVYGGKIYYIGGAHGQNDATVAQKTVQIYNPATNSWTKGADMPTGRDHISSSVVVYNNRILVLGGQTSYNVSSALVSAYKPATNTWQELTPLPVKKSTGVAAVINGIIYYTGGIRSKINYKGVPVQTASSTSVAEVSEITDQNLSQQIVVYPNPIKTNAKFSVELHHFAQEEQVSVWLIDMLGQTLQSTSVVTNAQGDATVAFPLQATINPGMYIIKAQSPSGKAQTRIMKE